MLPHPEFHYDPTVEHLTPGDIHTLRDSLLREQLIYCQIHSPFYAKMFKGMDFSGFTAADMKALPFTDKTLLTERNAEFRCVPMEEIEEIVFSSGTTGKPCPVAYSASDMKRLVYNEHRSLILTGLTKSDTVLLTCTLDRCFIAGAAYYLGARSIGATALRNGFSSMESHLDIITNLRPTAVIGVPSFLRNLGSALRERTGGNSSVRMLNLRRILAPLWLGAITSGLAFLMFLLSPTEGVRQLGYFAGASLILSLILMLFLLPLVLSRKTMRDPLSPGIKTFPRKHPVAVLFQFLIPGLLFAYFLPSIHFNGDVRQFDASSGKIAALEQKIADIFHAKHTPAFLVFDAPDRNGALEKSVQARKLSGAFHPALFCPPPSGQKYNLESWKTALADGTLEKYEKEVITQAEKLGFESAAFHSFFRILKQGIENPPPGTTPLVKGIFEHLLSRGKEGKHFYATALIPDSDTSLREAEEKCPDGVLISRTRLPERMADDAGHGILKILWFVGALVLTVTFLYFRSIPDSISALLPVAAALLVTGGLFAICGKNLNLASAITGIILCGLSVDYGIFMTHALRNGRDHAISGAITLSAVTTAFGGMTVLFTHHPLLRDAGTTLMCGILSAYLTAFFLLPALYEIKMRLLKKTEKEARS